MARYRYTSSGVRISVEVEANQGVDEQEVIVQMVHRSPCARTSGVPRIFFGGGGVQQIQLRTEDRQDGDLGVVAP